jgi:hypothetical protein
MQPSSQDLHPETGARFVFDRIGDDYDVAIYLPDGLRWSGRLSWADGNATLVPGPDQPMPSDDWHRQGRRVPETDPLAWAHAEALKLARTLRRTPKQHMVRWRGPS